MTDTGQVPGEALPENAGMVEQPGASAHGAYAYLSESPAEDEDLLLLPGAQSAWGNEVAPPAPEPVVEAVHEPGPHETDGRDSGSVDLSAVRLPGASAPQAAPRRPLHLGPPIPDASASPVRSLADRGPAGAPVRQPGPSASGPEYLDVPQLREMPLQGASPWGAAQATAQTPGMSGVTTAQADVPAPVAAQQQGEVAGVAQAVVARVATEAIAATAPQEPDAEHTAEPAPEPASPQTSSTGSYGVVDPGELLGAAMMAEAGQDLAEAADAALAGGDGSADAPVEPAPSLPADEDAAAASLTPEVAEPGGHSAAEAVGPVEPAEPAGAVEPTEAVEPAEPVADVTQTPDSAEEAPAAEAVQEPEPQPQPDAHASDTGPADAPAPAPQTPAESVPAADAPPVPEAVQAAEPEPAPAPEAESAPGGEAEQAEAPQPAEAVTEAAAETPEPAESAPEVPEAGHVQSADAVAEPVVVQADPAAAEQQSDEPASDAPQPQTRPTADAEPENQPEPDPELEHLIPTAAHIADPVSHAPDAPQPAAAHDGSPQPDPETALAPEAHLTEPQPQPETGPEPGPDDAATQSRPTPHPEPTAEPSPSVEEPAAATAAPEPPTFLADTVPAAQPVPAPADDASGADLATAAPQGPQPAPEPPEADHAAHRAPEAPSGHAVPEPAAQQPLGRFAPVDAAAPAPAHLAPAPPHPGVPATEEQPVPEPAPEAAAEAADEEPSAPEAAAPGLPAAAVPAPRETVPGETAPGRNPAGEAGHVPAAPDTADALQETGVPASAAVDPDVVQSPESLQTTEAEQDDEPAAGEGARVSAGPAAPGYDDAEREAVLKVMRERRDIRNGFRDDPIPHEVLLRVLEAAHTAPSVGHSQPWDFVVIRSADTRRAMHELAVKQRDAYAKSLPKGRAKQFKELKIEAILDTPVNIVVTADPTRGGRHTLGRHTQPQMAPYSSALAVENLWLAARAEGLGVGWVSFFDEREMVRALGLPEHLEVVAYLCVGYVDEFPEEPELMQAGWAKRRPLSWVVHEETYGRRALPGEDPHDLLAETVASVRPLDAKALGEAWERQKRMTKPAGALGMLEIISAQLSGLSRQCPPPIPEPAAVAIFAGDHGVHAQGVTPWPQEVTAQMVANFLGGGAVCNAFANQVGAEVCVVDVGVAGELPATPGLLPRKVRAGTSDMTTGPAMTREEAKQAIEVGIETARDLVAAGNKALLTGEMGIANTTASAALISVFTGADPAEVTGRGTGINDETLARKTEVVRRALDFHQPDPADPIGVLAAIGGFEHAAMVGLLLGGASLRTPVILDGVSAGAAALVARAIAPEVLAACIAGHRSAEPGHVAALNKLGLRPLVDLDLRLGEGTGALLALPLVQSTARAMHEVATFDSAGVTEK
ncbi:nicotinate-nucleotide--dimethylbenzimidazole phosphoribosyltransferase [Streptomyces sp. FL07-04A]|uniref:nicotinate-nucleotide--dimethylbenzimidazole phosphoribosyltransferase n=1 Tax=Streptomyces sp. FL07-04A TaxID=3028658 RepID=UPI0029B86D33|nr:nicotinate-nucleotide--dimethylbenzimidazole phosphoribosyltransferase [Streptomyces sp. FL07-04A]MDX3579629.1 nicotinate-nucleotide--dimethylbenzimidazole phosphoribosyltransferase [Streptomyces sp. FL07-04A]